MTAEFVHIIDLVKLLKKISWQNYIIVTLYSLRYLVQKLWENDYSSTEIDC